jgi:hypothetical protein
MVILFGAYWAIAGGTGVTEAKDVAAKLHFGK